MHQSRAYQAAFWKYMTEWKKCVVSDEVMRARDKGV